MICYFMHISSVNFPPIPIIVQLLLSVTKSQPTLSGYLIEDKNVNKIISILHI